MGASMGYIQDIGTPFPGTAFSQRTPCYFGGQVNTN